MEIVELKGPAHPDTLADSVVEACASALDYYYTMTYGKVLHYNVDKALFLAGNAEVYYGGGTILKPPTFVLGGQVSNLDRNRFILRKTIIDTVHKYLPSLKLLKVEIRCSNVSRNLDDISHSERVLCNDTSFSVGYWPYSENEQKVLDLRDALDEMIEKQDVPVGPDYKIMSTPRGITISAPLYAQQVHSREEYARYKQDIERALGDIEFNPDFAAGFPWLTLTGSSIESGDDGQVGRGNRYNGLITPCRPMTMEAFHGKNNYNHNGKLYSKIAFEKAKALYVETGKPTQVILVGRIGMPFDEPEVYIV